MVYIKRRERFNAAHKLYNPNWDQKRNEEVFGKCANANFHGHNYVLNVIVKGEIDPDTGFVINLSDLKEIIRINIVDKLDHKNLNLDVDFLKGKFTSTENLAVAIWDILAPILAERKVTLHCIHLEETENNSVEYYGN